MKFKKSFTLVELMIVIAIIAILSAIVIFTLNPSRLFDNFRDTRRVTDISSIHKAINFMESWNESAINYGNSNTLYISLPDTSTTCSSYTLPTLPSGYVYSCKPASTYKNADSTGWIPIDFTVTNGNRYLSSLPTDPVNDTTFFYSYYPGGSYELTALLKNPNDNSINDEDSLTGAFTLGSPNRSWNTPLSRDTNLVGHWKFDEGSGTIAYDSSGYGNNGTLTNGPTWTTLDSGETVLSFDGINDYVITPSFGISNNNGLLTICFWIKSVMYETTQEFISDNAGNPNNDYLRTYRTADNTNLTLQSATGSAINYTAGSNFFLNYDNQWILATIVADYNNRNIKWYRNNILFKNTNLNNNMLFPITSRIKYIGALNSSGTNSLFGYLDNIRIYNRALSAEEIFQIYNQTKSKYQ
jgi:prepilin-type N-terminal cleavage/methylation domain-containing protein